MAIIILAGLYLMTLAAFIETITAFAVRLFARHKSKAHRYSRLEWDNNSVLHLQRLAHEGQGLGTWSVGASGVPITASGEQLGMLYTTNSELPVLRRPDTKTDPQDIDTRRDDDLAELLPIRQQKWDV